MNIFFNHSEFRIRAGWRIAFQMIIMEGIAFVLYLITGSYTRGIAETVLIMAIAAILSVWLSARYFDRRSLRDLGIRLNRTWWFEFSLGLLISAVAMLFIFITEWSFGWLEVGRYVWDNPVSPYWPLYLGGYLLLMLLVGFYEELMFRGYQLTNLLEGLSVKGQPTQWTMTGAVVVSSILFGAGHVENPNVSLLSIINIIIAGIMLAIPFLVTGRLGLSIGLHAGWNFVEGSILGFPVSGLKYHHTLITINQNGPSTWTGGTFGPEGGMLGAIAIALVILIEIIYFGIILNANKKRLFQESALQSGGNA